MQHTIFTYPLVIKEIYLDTFGHVNNATYLSLFEEARWDLITKHGYGINKIQETGLGPTILELKLVFLKELRVREEVVIETQMKSYENKIGHLAQRIVRNDEVRTQAEFVFGLFSVKERKLVPPTEDWLKAIGIAQTI